MTQGRAVLGAFFPGSGRRPINHGTVGGHRAHFRYGVPMCEPCRVANRKARGSEPFSPAQCGTRSGYRSHRRRGEETCTDCRAVENAYQRRRTAERRSS